MNMQRIEQIMQANSDRVTLFVTDCLMVYHEDSKYVQTYYEQGTQIDGGSRYNVNEVTAVVKALNANGFLVSVFEDRN